MKENCCFFTLTAIAFNCHEQDNCKLSNLDKTKKTSAKRIIKSLMSTPNYAIYLELGLIPIEYEIKRRKLGFLHKILNSDKKDEKGIKAKIYNEKLLLKKAVK